MRTPAEILQYREGYDQGYNDGGIEEDVKLSIMLERLELAESLEADEDYDTIRNMAKRIKELESELSKIKNGVDYLSDQWPGAYSKFYEYIEKLNTQDT